MDFKQQLFQNGYVIIPNLVNSSENGSFIDEVLIYLNSIPRLNDRRINITKEELTNDLLKSRVKELRTNWMLHSSFGAPTELNSFQFVSSPELVLAEFYYLLLLFLELLLVRYQYPYQRRKLIRRYIFHYSSIPRRLA